jgi:hypothetical protein
MWHDSTLVSKLRSLHPTQCGSVVGEPERAVVVHRHILRKVFAEHVRHRLAALGPVTGLYATIRGVRFRSLAVG